MFSLTLRATTEAKLPKAARRSCVHSLGHGICIAPPIGWYRGLATPPVASSLGTIDRANGIDRPFQGPEARP